MPARHALIALVATARPAHAHAQDYPVDVTVTARAIAANYQTRTALLRDAADQLMVGAGREAPAASLAAWLREQCPW